MRRRRFLLATAAIACLSGCSGDGDTTERGTGGDTDTSEMEGEPALPAGLHEEGLDLARLRSAVGELITSGSFRGIGGIDYYEQGEVASSTSRSVGGINESERGRELEATGGVSLYEKVDGSITPDEASIDILREHGELRRYFEDDTLYRGRENPVEGEFSYADYLEHVAGYADEVFSMLEAFQYASPEWDSDLGLFRVPITGFAEGGDDYVVENAEIHVTRDGLPVAAGGRLAPTEGAPDDTLVEERLIVLRSDGIDIERPEWVETTDPGN